MIKRKSPEKCLDKSNTDLIQSIMLDRDFEFNEEKNILLKKSRGVDFVDVLEAINKGNLIKDIKHPSKKYPHQGLLIVDINAYAYAVPYVYDKKRNITFLKTIYPSRKLTRSYLKKYHEKKKKRDKTV